MKDNKEQMPTGSSEGFIDISKKIILCGVVILVIIVIGIRNNIIHWKFWEKSKSASTERQIMPEDQKEVIEPVSEPIVTEQAVTKSTPSDKVLTQDDIKQVIKDYLHENPEVIVEAIQAWQRKMEQNRIKNTQSLLSSNLDKLKVNRPYLGAKNATISIIEFFDYRCGYCKSSHMTLEKVLGEYPNVQVVLENTPMLGDKSMLASKASVAVWSIAPDKFAKFHKDLLNAPDINDQLIASLGKQYNIDNATLLNSMSSDQVKNSIADNIKIAQQVGVQGIPAFVVNGEYIAGNISYEDLKAKIDKAIAPAKPAVQAPTPAPVQPSQ